MCVVLRGKRKNDNCEIVEKGECTRKGKQYEEDARGAVSPVTFMHACHFDVANR